MVNDLVFTTPEKAGLSSKKVLKFIDKTREMRINLHSFMLVKNGEILTEGYYKPFHKDFMHRLYSCSKTFVSLAIGKLAGEGKIRLEDKIIDYFPDLLDREQGKWMKECTIEDALKMSVPMLTDTYTQDMKEWAWSFFNRLPDLKPAGTVFNYNTSGSFILDVIVERVTGKTFLEYLRPEFDKIGVSKDIWCVKAPDNYSWGGSGVVATLRDFAKVGELIMNLGEYKGEQLLPRWYMEKATTTQIYNCMENNSIGYRGRGYGYQIWMHDDGFCLSGMGAQMVFCFPKKNFMFVCQGDTQSSADYSSRMLLHLVKDYFYDEMSDSELPVDEVSFNALQERVNALTVNIPIGKDDSPFAGQIDGVTYRLQDNALGWKNFRFDFSKKGGVLTYENARGVKQIPFGCNEYADITFPETDYYDTKVGTPAGRGLRALATVSWVEEKKILLRVNFIDINLGNIYINFGFKGDEVGICAMKRAEFFAWDYEGYAGGKADK